ncbi:hypothetical protein PVAND_004268 [Polypedilum vanderplanki]|nr:hypothetical protein PVAND_004268 [Polypedilum vanderplanki]
MRKNRNIASFKNAFKEASINLKKIIKEEKIESDMQRFSNKDTKKMWQSINSVLGRSKNSDITSININDEIIENKNLIAEEFNRHFISSVSELINSIPDNIYNKHEEYSTALQSCHIIPPTDDEIISIIVQLKNSSCGLDGIKSSHLKHISASIAPLLRHLINKIIETGVYPNALKIATVVPICKGGDSKNVANYRPISILSTLNKVIEKFLHDRLTSFLDKNHVIYKRQYGFRKKCNTEIAALELINDVRSQLDIKKKVALIMLDLKKAFDVVDHLLLTESLERYGIRGSILDLFANYLSDRRQIVKIGDTYSSCTSIKSGVIQGSVLGPLLFSIFINDISKLPLKGKLYLYADDVVIAIDQDPQIELASAIQHDMKLIISKLQSKKLILNTSKSNFLIIHSPYQKVILEDIVQLDNNTSLVRVEYAKYLGLVIDQSLKWDVHVNSLETKLASAAGALWKLKNRLPLHIKKTIYQSLVESNLYYMSTIWGTASDAVLKPIQILQNRALRNVYNLDRLENRVKMYTHLVSDCLPIRAISYLSTATIIYNILNKRTHSNLSFVKQSSNSRTLRRNDTLRATICRTNRGSKSINFLGIHIYNNVPDEIKKLKHSYAFKWALKCNIRNENFIKLCFNNDYLSRFC